MKTWDAIIVGGGIIGLSLALELRRHGARVLLVERGEPGREASHAAAGMLAFCDPETPLALRDLCFASARLFPEFVHQLEDESGRRVDFRREGAIAITFFSDDHDPLGEGWRELLSDEVAQLEPFIAPPAGMRILYLPEQTVDNRALALAALQACKHREIEIASGAEVTAIDVEGGRACGIRTTRTHFTAPVVVNCAGCWAGQISPVPLPTRPRKGQMLSVVDPEHQHRRLLSHVVRSPQVYLVPRSDGRLLIGATVEDVGFDKRVDPAIIQRLHQDAANLVPEIGQMRMHEAWAGLRPGTPDDLPILGATAVPGYFVATGHYRNGILLSPLTARLMTSLIRGQEPGFDLSPFSASRFG
jgi:glycine oxidase ThiO